MTLTVLNCHTWYLTEENISLSLLNKNISLEIRTELAKKIFLQHMPSVEIRKPTLPSITSKSGLVDIVGGRSRVLFDLLDIPII